jgi:hypothetical protein
VRAQPGIAVDRFAREIVRFLKVVGGALAATECQPVGRPIILTTGQTYSVTLSQPSATQPFH